MFGLTLLAAYALLFDENYLAREVGEKTIKAIVIRQDMGYFLDYFIGVERDAEARRRLVRCRWAYRNIKEEIKVFPPIQGLFGVPNDRIVNLDVNALEDAHLRQILHEAVGILDGSSWDDEVARAVTERYVGVLFERGWTRKKVLMHLRGVNAK